MKLFNAFLLAIIIVFLIKKFKQQEGFETKPCQKLPDDIFSDGLDNNMGLNKQHRHHSF